MIHRLFGRKKQEPEIEGKEPKRTEIINLEESFLIPKTEIPENQMQSFVNAVEITRQAKANLKKAPILYQDEESGRIKAFYVDIFLPLKAKDESVLWYRTKHEGVLNKKLREFDVVTNYRAYSYDVTIPQTCAPCFLTELNEVVVTNQKRYSASIRQGSFAGMGARGTFAGSIGGISQGQSETIGDVNIMSEGQILFTFYSVEDPHGLASLLKQVIKNKKVLVEKLDEQEKNDNASKTVEKNEIICQKCGTSNPPKSKFCNKCDAKLASICTKCGANNPDESSFCNKCGFALK